MMAYRCLRRWLSTVEKYKPTVVKMKGCAQIFSNPRMQISVGFCSDVNCVVSVQESVFYVTGSIIYYIYYNMYNI